MFATSAGVIAQKKANEVSAKDNSVAPTEFAYNGGNPLQADSYEHASISPSCPNGTDEICYIVAEVENPSDPEADWKPVMSNDLLAEIQTILDTDAEYREETDNVKLRLQL